jgi:hypothetical protein
MFCSVSFGRNSFIESSPEREGGGEEERRAKSEGGAREGPSASRRRAEKVSDFYSFFFV